VDDHSRFAYTEILDDEKNETAAGFWERPNEAFNAAGITVKRVLTDNGSCYRSHAFKDALGPDITHKRTRPYRPQTNGKASNASTALCSRNGPTPAPTPQRPTCGGFPGLAP
jgi:transposase InsO family protein